MIQSMTGYGRAAGSCSLGEMVVELRGVNSKHLDLKMHIPRFLFPLEASLKKFLQSRLQRGRLDCSVNLDRSKSGGFSTA